MYMLHSCLFTWCIELRMLPNSLSLVQLLYALTSLALDCLPHEFDGVQSKQGGGGEVAAVQNALQLLLATGWEL